MSRTIHGSVVLPGSKSESNRALMIAAYGGFPLDVVGLSDAHDTLLLQQLLKLIATSHPPVTLDCEDAGTVARFLLTYLAGREGEWLLTGTARMCQRPMRPLVDALLQLGAVIEYQGAIGFLPLKVKGRTLTGGKLSIDASQSSQFVSSLLLAAPCWRDGLQLRLEGGPASTTYITMSIAMMRRFGAEVRHEGDTIIVAPGAYQPQAYKVSADWSSASYWYELMALSEGGRLLLKDLKEEAIQGDRVVAGIFADFGVETRFASEGAWLTKNTMSPSQKIWRFSLSNTPDLFPAIFTTCVALHLPAVFFDTQNLALKESNRVDSLITELSKLYTFINSIDNNSIVIDNSVCIYSNLFNNEILFSSHNDHRVVMSLAPLKMLFPRLHFDEPEVVAKSYLGFWREFESLLVQYP